MHDVTMGILVGGASRRMGGRPKGLLDAGGGDGESIVARLLRIGRAVASEVVLVGDLPDYDALGVRRIRDFAPSRGGPLAGLVALIEATSGRDVIAVACDLPRLAPSILERLAALPPSTTAAPKVDSIWQPTVARYSSTVLGEARRRLVRGEGALHRLLDAVSATVLTLDPAEISSLVDWDSPEDIPAGPGRM